MNRTGKKKKNRWVSVLLIWDVLLLLAGSAVCVVLYKYLEVYEISRPETVIEELTNQNFRELTGLLAESLKAEDYPFEDIRALFRDYCEQNLSEKKLTYYEEKSKRTDDKAFFVIRAGGFSLCRAEVQADDTVDLRFGRKMWKLGEIFPSEALDSLRSVTLHIRAPENMPVYLNEKLLTAEYIRDSGQELPDMTELEASFDMVPKLVTYSVGPLYGEISVKNDNGRVITPRSISENELLAELIPDKTSIQIEAPDDLTVIVGGVKLGIDYVSDTDDSLFSGLEKYIGEQHWKTVKYSIDGLYTVPEIKALDVSGRVLFPIESGENRFRFYHEDESAPDEIKTAADTFFRAYLEYSSKGSGGDRYFNLINSLVSGTELHKYVLDSYEAMQWASKTELNIDSLDYDHFSKVNDRCCFCTVSYSADLTATSWVDKYSYSAGGIFELILAFEGGRWQVAAMREVNLE